MDNASYDGVGFIIPKGMVVIDIDNKSPEDPLAMKLLKVASSYAELSPSNKGLHIIAYVDTSKVPQSDRKLDTKYYCKNPHNSIEMYFGGLTNRYMTFTGNAINEEPITDITAKVNILLDTYMKKENFKKDTKLEQSLDDFDIISIARKAKNCEKFISLYDMGNITRYHSHSEADQALCNILSFYTGGNFEKIEHLFSQSKLVTEKWLNREDYRKMTINSAIESCNGKFYIGSRPTPSYIYYDERSKKMKISCPMLARHIRENLHYIFVRDSAKGGVLRYVYEDGCYRLYADDMLKGIIKAYITDFDESILRMSDVNEVFGQITTDLVFVTDNDLNADEDIINFQNGILKLSDMAVIPHNTDILSTIQIGCDWKGVPSPTPVFDEFMNTLTNNDIDIQNLLLQFIGVCFSNIKGWRMKKALFMVGSGDTGKSQLKSLVERLLGRGNFVGIDIKEIEARFGTSNIYGKRLAGSSDMSFLTMDELKTFKKCTGGDSLFAEFKGQNGFEFTYNGLLWFCMNRLPKFGGDDGEWVYNRIMQVQCTNVIPLHKQDKYLLDKLYDERDGIIYKAITALKQVIANGYTFNEPESVATARKTYMAENNTVITFFEECMEERPTGKITDSCTTGKVYDIYKAWCNDNNHGYSKTAKEFRTELSHYLNASYSELITRRGKGGNFYKSYTLTYDAKETYKRVYGYDETEFFSSN
jgi:P4 family phage/plasmid primase-like protien